MNISIASDHAGFEQKEILKTYLQEKGYVVADEGPATDERVDYPDYAKKVAQKVALGQVQCGVLVCGTGIGMALAADKVPGCRAANIITEQFATLARQHNDANIVTLSGRCVDVETNKKILDAFLTTSFEGGRHEQRVQKIMEIDTQ
ncbi:MAG: ribose 5-phosphate isomerase B [Eggerthellaceae bacterium]|nr:ribose 5-phosphate isomerase B [Eggerthellaceae bacterium]